MPLGANAGFGKVGCLACRCGETRVAVASSPALEQHLALPVLEHISHDTPLFVAHDRAHRQPDDQVLA
ncbi:hypothetical protein SDC9_162419 [bioreactor metagenome]|uniref:Uncharacterized protein n=1 Tax=bioreactor metagenome TaxID=1076179 RepID=A0A645FMB8_9ZZZZ